MVNVGIIGASGYTGGELLRFLSNHSKAEVTTITSRQYEGKKVYKIHPHIRDSDLIFENKKPSEIDADVVFTATPHGASMKIVPDLLDVGIKVIDLSGDYRYDNINVYEKWYGLKHTGELDAVFGLPELYRDRIKKADLVANPGCFPTGSILASYPIVNEKIVDRVIIDAKSGVSGTGVNPTSLTHFPVCSDNVVPYKVTSHRHTSEIAQELSKADKGVKVSFTPHLVPVIRGIISTVHVFLKEDVKESITTSNLEKLYQDKYFDEPFIEILVDGEMPHLSSVRGSNFAHIGCFEIDDTNRLVIVSAIDNLVKGASGQAVHNMNIMFGFNEKDSLESWGMHP
jgi:N-acetyl-gamma-glutamyl-phosphate reductase